MCYDKKKKNGKESDYHGKMEQKIIRSCSNRQCRSRSGLLFKEVKEKMRTMISTMILKTKTSIWIMTSNRLTVDMSI